MWRMIVQKVAFLDGEGGPDPCNNNYMADDCTFFAMCDVSCHPHVQGGLSREWFVRRGLLHIKSI